MDSKDIFVDIDFSQSQKYSEDICGDAFKFVKQPAENRLIAVLSDGLGSGVKANILASMTATMALKFASEDRNILHSAEIMMSALPVCQVRKISYATFTIVNTALFGRTRVIEMGNPEFLLIRNGVVQNIEAEVLESDKWKNRTIKIYDFDIEPNDRLIMLSDGITQAGIGTPDYKLGWRRKGCIDFVQGLIEKNPSVSSHQLSSAIVKEAKLKEENGVSYDDMTCGVVFFRAPKKMILFTGPPFNKEHDAKCAEMIDTFPGQKVVCGGTTSDIVARELNRPVKMDLMNFHSDLPPASKMAGIDLVTEGIFTLTKAAQYLENGIPARTYNAARDLVDILRENDIIEFVVGTRINDAHQDPNLPIDLEIRRNIVKRISTVLEKKYLKEVKINYV